MVTDPIPEPVHRLIRQHISSASQLEVLTLLVENEKVWSISDVADALRLPVEYAQRLLRGLVTARLIVAPDDGFRFDPANAPAVVDLVDCYRRYRLRVTSMIYGQPPKPVRDFADAFRLRSPDDVDDAEED